MQNWAFMLWHLKTIREHRWGCLEACLRFLLFGDENEQVGIPMNMSLKSSLEEDEGLAARKSRDFIVLLLRNNKNLAQLKTSQGVFGLNGRTLFFISCTAYWWKCLSCRGIDLFLQSTPSNSLSSTNQWEEWTSKFPSKCSTFLMTIPISCTAIHIKVVWWFEEHGNMMWPPLLTLGSFDMVDELVWQHALALSASVFFSDRMTRRTINKNQNTTQIIDPIGTKQENVCQHWVHDRWPTESTLVFETMETWLVAGQFFKFSLSLYVSHSRSIIGNLQLE